MIKDKLTKITGNKRLIRYFFIACTVVFIELIAFQIIYLFSHNYQVATVLSFVVAVVLNWILGRVVVFGPSAHHPLKEFLMVLAASVVGLMIQLGVVTFSVEVLEFYPLVAKVLSIIFSFFWNYWFRSKLIYSK